MMSKFLAKTVKKTTLLSVILAVILAAAIALGIVCTTQHWSILNKDPVLRGGTTITVSMNADGQNLKHDEIVEACESVFAENNVKPSYSYEGVKGWDGEILYVFNNGISLAEVEKDLEAKFDALSKNEWKDYVIQITVATNAEEKVSFLAEYFVLRGIIAGLALATLVFVYMVLRNGLEKGIAVGVSTAGGVLLTTALLILFRIPVTASAAYVIAAAGLLSAAIATVSMNKIRAAEKAETAQDAEEVVTSSLATCDITLIAVFGGLAIVLMGAIATAGARWFAIASLVALVVSVFMGLIYAPSLYLPLKKAADSKPNKDAYIGAKKTSKREKKAATPAVNAVEEAPEIIPVKAAPVEEAPVEEPVVEEAPIEEAPVEEPVVEETPIEEAPAEEPVAEEAPVEETPAEETTTDAE